MAQHEIIIMFSGHRDCTCQRSALEDITLEYPSALWIHGGARGFDTQVELFAKAHRIPTQVFLPDYTKHKKSAPIIRNIEMLQQCDLLVACYDGRKTGGTYDTIKKAKRLGKSIRFVTAVKIGEQ